jgi:hypothetical protein
MPLPATPVPKLIPRTPAEKAPLEVGEATPSTPYALLLVEFVSPSTPGPLPEALVCVPLTPIAESPVLLLSAIRQASLELQVVPVPKVGRRTLLSWPKPGRWVACACGVTIRTAAAAIPTAGQENRRSVHISLLSLLGSRPRLGVLTSE